MNAHNLGITLPFLSYVYPLSILRINANAEEEPSISARITKHRIVFPGSYSSLLELKFTAGLGNKVMAALL